MVKDPIKEVNESDSQVEVTPFVMELTSDWGLSSLNSPEDLSSLRSLLYNHLIRIPYGEEVVKEEEAIRWKRTGSEVLEDGYTYQTKDCTDIVLAYIVFCRAYGVEEWRFVKIKNKETGGIHSVVEVLLSDNWFVFDVSNLNAIPQSGQIESGKPFKVVGVDGDYNLWKKGRDSWDIGLHEFGEGKKVVD